MGWPSPQFREMISPDDIKDATAIRKHSNNCSKTLAFPFKIWITSRLSAGVVELVDTQDLKSCSCIGVPVRFRPPAPSLNETETALR